MPELRVKGEEFGLGQGTDLLIGYFRGRSFAEQTQKTLSHRRIKKLSGGHVFIYNLDDSEIASWSFELYHGGSFVRSTEEFKIYNLGWLGSDDRF